MHPVASWHWLQNAKVGNIGGKMSSLISRERRVGSDVRQECCCFTVNCYFYFLLWRGQSKTRNPYLLLHELPFLFPRIDHL